MMFHTASGLTHVAESAGIELWSLAEPPTSQ